MDKEEIEKMSDIELLHAYAGCNDMKLYQASEKELLKRLKKSEIWSYTNITPEQAVEEFKKELVEEINKLYVDGIDYLCNKIEVIDIIKNTK